MIKGDSKRFQKIYFKNQKILIHLSKNPEKKYHSLQKHILKRVSNIDKFLSIISAY